jgi:hypothetical protein
LSLPLWVILIAAALVVLIGVATYWDVSRLYRGRLLEWQESRWRRSGRMPSAVQRAYRSVSEYRQDAVRMHELGFRVVDESSNSLRGDRDWVEAAGPRAMFKGPPRPVARGIPAVFVIYERPDPTRAR